ncbi:cell division protein FtsL [Maricaulis sp.]|uniref:cell division protein FtsL n=1 Tax=Maricaulis sp. TaxID=1486257 RepID=UPI003A933AD6
MIRTFNAIALVVAVALAGALYVAKTEAKNSQERLEDIQSQLVEERRQINVLNVEIAHLEDPERLRLLARRYLGFEPLDTSREVALSDLPLLAEPGVEIEQPRREGLLVNQGDQALALAEPREVGGQN